MSKTLTFSRWGCSDAAEEISTKWERRLGHEAHVKAKSFLTQARLSAASERRGLLTVQGREANERGCDTDKVWAIVTVMTVTSKRRQHTHK